MASRRPEKRQREKRFTVLAVGEGDTEVVLLDHLKRIYLERGRRSVQIVNAHGGSPEHVLDKTDRLTANSTAAYNRVMILLDGDRVEDDKQLKKRAGKNHVLVVVPCIEALLLSVFDSTRDWSQQRSTDLKSTLHKRYLSEAEKLKQGAYGQKAAFSRESIESLRENLKSTPRAPSAETIKILDDLIRLVFE